MIVVEDIDNYITLLQANPVAVSNEVIDQTDRIMESNSRLY